MRIKTQLLTLLLAFAATSIFAQTPSQTPAGAGTQTPVVSAKHQDMHHLTHDIRNERKEKAIRRHDMKNGNVKGTVRTTRHIRRDNRNERRNVKDLKAKGVEHPVHRAVHRIRTH